MSRGRYDKSNKQIGIRKAAKTFNLPRTTLQSLSKRSDVFPFKAVLTKIGRKTVLEYEFEKQGSSLLT